MAKKHRPKGEKKRGLSAPHAHAKKRASSEEDTVGGTRGIKDVKDMDLDDLLGIEVSDGPSPGELSEGSSSSEDDLELTREDMEKLKETDPEFYSYLKSTDEGLLDFNVDEDEDEEEKMEEEEEEEEENDEEQEEEEPKAASVVITSESLKSWCAAAQKTASLGAVKQMTRLYRIACHYGDEEAGEESLQLASSAVYNNILLFMLGKADDIFRKALVIDSDDVDVTKQPRWPKYESLIRSYLGNTLHLLGKLTDPKMQSYILKRTRQSAIFFRDYDKIRRKFIALAMKIFSSAEDEPRVQAILFVRALSMSLPSLCLDSCLKAVYKSFVSASKFFTAASAPSIRFMASCAVEMYGIDLGATYQHAFVAVKDLASQMRQALTSKSKESYKEVYCWQTINSLELWVTVLVAYPEDLEALFFPVSQLLIGACSLIGSPSFIPLRLKCIRMMNELALCRQLYIPAAPLLLEILQWKDLGRKPKPVAANSIPDISLRLRVGSSILRASAFQEEVVDTVFELLSSHLGTWGYHPAFFEIGYIPLLRLRAFIKSNNRDRFKRGAKQICQAIVETQEIISRARNQAQFSPKDNAAIQVFCSDLEAKGPTPIIKLSMKLQEQTKQRLKMKSMEDAFVDEESDEEEPKVPRKKQKVAQSIEQSTDEESAEVEQSDHEDEIGVYQLSDDE